MPKELPIYKCHKEVKALKIKAVRELDDGQIEITPADRSYEKIIVKKLSLGDHETAVGGYYVQYDGGYESWSPAKAFEAGYTKIPENFIAC